MWKLLSSSRIGEQHIAAHRPCQDRWLAQEVGERFIYAVADGHGGRAYPRAETGAEFACEAAVEVLGDETIAFGDAAEKIKQCFDRKVAEDLLASPLNDEEKRLVNAYPEKFAYGTTLVCAAITPTGLYRCQVGDGEIHALDSSGYFLPSLEEDPNCIGFFTSSLVAPDAVRTARWAFDEAEVGAVVLYSDGYVPDGRKPWALLGLIGTDAIPEEVLEAGQRGDDQTVLVAFNENCVSEGFKEGYTIEREKHRLESKALAVRSRMSEANLVINCLIKRLYKAPTKERGDLLEKITARNEGYLALWREHEAIQQELKLLEEKMGRRCDAPVIPEVPDF